MGTQSALSLDGLPGVESGWEVLTVNERRAAGTCSAASLEADTARRDLIVSALAEGRPLRTIAKAFGISTNLLLAAKRKYAPQIETEKERLGHACMDLARLSVERLTEEIDDVPLAQLAVVTGIMVDKGQLLMGAPTARVRNEHAVTVASMADYIASLPAAAPVNEDGESGQKAGSDLRVEGEGSDARLAEGMQGCAEERSRDSQSHAFKDSERDSRDMLTDSCLIERGNP